MRTLIGVLAAAAQVALAQEEFTHNGGHGDGHYYYNGTGLFLFWLFFIIIIVVLLFGCVGGVYNWNGHAHTIHVGRIIDRDAQGNVQRVRDINDTTTSIVDEDPYYRGDRGRPGYYYAAGATHGDNTYILGSDYGKLQTTDAGGRVVQLATNSLPGGTLPLTGSSALGQERPIGAAAAKKAPLRLEL